MLIESKHFELFFHLIKREISSRYKGSLLGLFWIVFIPILSLSVYTLVFGKIFQIKWHTTEVDQFELAALLYSGLLLFQFFAESINQAPNTIIQNSNYVKKVVFPLYLLPTVKVSAAFFHLLVGLVVLTALVFITQGKLHITYLSIILIMIPLVLFTLGLSWILASLGVYFRDITHGIGIFISLLLFLCPIFYPAEAIPDDLKAIIYLNPFTFLIEQARDVIIWGNPPNLKITLIYIFVSLAFAYCGKFWFEKTKNGFADVI